MESPKQLSPFNFRPSPELDVSSSSNSLLQEKEYEQKFTAFENLHGVHMDSLVELHIRQSTTNLEAAGEDSHEDQEVKNENSHEDQEVKNESEQKTELSIAKEAMNYFPDKTSEINEIDIETPQSEMINNVLKNRATATSRGYSYFDDEDEEELNQSECSEIQILKLLTDTNLNQSLRLSDIEKYDGKKADEKENKMFLYPNIMRTLCIICIVGHHYNEKHDYSTIYDCSAEQWVLWYITALCGTFQVFSKSPLTYRCSILMIIFIFGVLCNFAAMDFVLPKSGKSFMDKYVFQMAFIILIFAQYIILHPFKIFFRKEIKTSLYAYIFSIVINFRFVIRTLCF